MELNVNIPAELGTRLEQAARAEGMSADEFVVKALQRALTDEQRGSALEMLRRWREEDQTDSPREIGKRKKSWEKFKKGMNANHSSGRRVYP